MYHENEHNYSIKWFTFPCSFFHAATQPGSHWIIFDTLTPSIGASGFEDSHRLIYYCDSFGQPPPPNILSKLLTYAQTVIFSDVIIQDFSTILCGPHTILIGKLRARGYSLLNILTCFYHAQDENYLRNDFVAWHFLKSITSSGTPIRDQRIFNWEYLLENREKKKYKYG